MASAGVVLSSVCLRMHLWVRTQSAVNGSRNRGGSLRLGAEEAAGLHPSEPRNARD